MVRERSQWTRGYCKIGVYLNTNHIKCLLHPKHDLQEDAGAMAPTRGQPWKAQFQPMLQLPDMPETASVHHKAAYRPNKYESGHICGGLAEQRRWMNYAGRC